MPQQIPFPQILLDFEREGTDANPGIQLFGRRFFIDQTLLEHLTEFLLVVNSPKRFSGNNTIIETFLPSWTQIHEWPNGKCLEYRAPIRLNLKLFAFLGASRLDTRHESHKKHYKDLLVKLENVMHTVGVEKRDVLRSLENLYLGFQGVGIDRTWCAQTLFPISKAFLLQETIWNETEARRQGPFSWNEMLTDFNKLFSVSKHRFMARGGELLYLQLCNAFRERGSQLSDFLAPYDLIEYEQDPKKLIASLEKCLGNITNKVPEALDSIIKLIDTIDGHTWNATNKDDNFTECGWCPEDSWQEGYLFAVELNMLCHAMIDPIERIELLMVGCGLQILRSLCAQTMRYCQESVGNRKNGSLLNFTWIISDPDGSDQTAKQLSQRNLSVILAFIQQALRTKEIYENAKKSPRTNIEKLYDEADTRYGHKLFLSIGKRLGFIVPNRGPGARFIFTDRVLRYLVLALIPPGQRRTFEDFKKALYDHYGIAIEGKELANALSWCNFPKIETGGIMGGNWLMAMLQASGFLIHLSDACSLVYNPFSLEE